jgi:hypothetical protein
MSDLTAVNDRYVVAVVESDGSRWFEPVNGVYEGEDGANTAASVAGHHNAVLGRRATVLGVR